MPGSPTTRSWSAPVTCCGPPRPPPTRWSASTRATAWSPGSRAGTGPRRSPPGPSPTARRASRSRTPGRPSCGSSTAGPARCCGRSPRRRTPLAWRSTRCAAWPSSPRRWRTRCARCRSTTGGRSGAARCCPTRSRSRSPGRRWWWGARAAASWRSSRSTTGAPWPPSVPGRALPSSEGTPSRTRREVMGGKAPRALGWSARLGKVFVTSIGPNIGPNPQRMEVSMNGGVGVIDLAAHRFERHLGFGAGVSEGMALDERGRTALPRRRRARARPGAGRGRAGRLRRAAPAGLSCGGCRSPRRRGSRWPGTRPTTE